jgi:hypothetical protein
MARAKSGGGGGGIHMSKNVKTSVKAGPPSTNVVSPASADQLGRSLAFKGDPLPIRTAPQVPIGNATALTAGQGPGAGRSTLRCGSQGTHGPVDRGRSPAARDILSDFGPDSPRRK